MDVPWRRVPGGTAPPPWPHGDWADSGVAEPSARDLASVVGGRPTLLVVYAPWCGHCRRAAPEVARLARYVRAHNELHGTRYRVSALRGDAPPENRELAARLGVASYPALDEAFPASPPQEYDGERDAPSLWDALRTLG